MQIIKNKKIISTTVAALTAACALAGCVSDSNTEPLNNTSSSEPAVREFFAMDTYMTLTAYGENAATAVRDGEELIKNLENELSTEIESSYISELNKNGHAYLSEAGFNLLNRSLEINEMTDGAFNIAIYPIMKEWGFTTKNYTVPSDEKIKSLLNNMDLSGITFDSKTGEVTFENKDMDIDFGGIAKGFASASVTESFKEKGITSAMVNLGGNVQLLGNKTDGSNWKVGIRSPYEDVDFLGILEASDVAVITSGGYERYFEQDGKTYHHIMDPSTGYPAESGLISVTIVSHDAILADALSTSLFVMGKDKATDFWHEHKGEFDAILMDKDNSLYVTEGIADNFSSENYPITVIN